MKTKKRNTYKFYLLAVLLLILPIFVYLQAQEAQSDVGATLQKLLDEKVEEQDILGMIMAVRGEDRTIVSRSSGYLDPSEKDLWTMRTQSALGSITKTFTAVVIMQLLEEGKLSLDETINAWFPEQPNGNKITLRMLLSHTSGLANYITGENVMDPKWTHEWTPLELIAEANKMEPFDEPGTKLAHYSNTNYILLGLVIEKITGNSWEAEVRSRIIEPLELKDTTFLGDAGVWGGSMVEGYARIEGSYVSSLNFPSYPHSSTTWAAGGLVSTLEDLMTFASAIFDGKLVSKESLALMATPVGEEIESGMLWGLGGATLANLPGGFGMGGDIPGYHAIFIGTQDGKALVAGLVNTQEGDVIGPSMMALEYLMSLEADNQ